MAITLDVIQSHPTWSVIDPSKLTEYMRCPRKYFYKYILGWQSEYPNNDLIFGSAWHLAMEQLLRGGYTTESLYEASKLFFEHYRKHFDKSTDDLFEPKNPEIGLEVLADYTSHYQSDQRDYEVLSTEIGGIVSVSGGNNLFFKIDAILRRRDNGKILFMDHKTAKKKYQDWGEHWVLSTQMLTYTHVLHCLYPPSEIEGGKIRSTFFYKHTKTKREKKEHFDEILIKKTSEQMNAWVSRVNHWINTLDQELLWLIEEDSPDGRVMSSFPMNDTACFSFGKKCIYFDLCDSWSNPLKRCEALPIGIKQEYWDPRESETIRENVDLT